MTVERGHSDDEFVGRVREALDAQRLAPEIADRLAAARRRAVAMTDAPTPHAPSSWVPLGALAATLLTVAVGVVLDNGGNPPLEEVQQLATVEDLDLLMDLEFVAWLDTDNTDAG